MLEMFRALILLLSLSAAGPHMGCNQPPGRETVCWVVDSGRVQYLTPANIQSRWPKLAERWGVKR